MSTLEAQVWWADRSAASHGLERLLDADERGRFAAYRGRDDRDRFLLGCALAKIVVAKRTGTPATAVRLLRTCPRCGKPHGKPRVVEPAGTGLELSVSHSAQLVGVALTASAPVGLDVEGLGRLDVEELTPVALTSAEADAVAASRPQERTHAFLVAWTRKEAVTKASGEGLGLEPRDVTVAAPGEDPRLLSWPLDVPPEDVALFDLRARPGHVASLAVLGACESVVELDGTPLLDHFRRRAGR